MKGVVKMIKERHGKAKSTGKPFTTYSVGVQVDGQGDDWVWYNQGFDRPDVSEGSVVEYDVEVDEKYNSESMTNIELLKDERPKEVNSSSGYSYSGNSNDARQKSICMQSATERAIGIIRLAMDKEVITTKDLGKKADQLDNLSALVDEEANRLYVRFMNTEEYPDLDDGNEASEYSPV